MSVKELFVREDSRFETVSGIDVNMKIRLQDAVKSLLWVSAAVVITALLSNLI